MAFARKLHIAIDLDGIVVDLANVWLDLYNTEHNDSVTVHDLKNWEMADNVKIGHEIYKYLNVPGLYRTLKPLPGAVEALRRLHQQGHDLHIITAASADPNTASDKIHWCHEYLPFLKRQQITTSHKKERYVSDVFIDDSPDNLAKHAAFQPRAIRMGIAWPYNEACKDIMTVRAESYKDTKKAWEQLTRAIDYLVEAAP